MHHEERMVVKSQAFGVVDLESGVSFVCFSKKEEVGFTLILFMLSISLKFSEIVGIISHEFSDLILPE